MENIGHFMKSILLILLLLNSLSAFSYSSVKLMCKTSKQESQEISIEVFEPSKNGEELYLVKKEFLKDYQNPVESIYHENLISSIRKFISPGIGRFSDNEEIILVTLINEKESDKVKAIEYYICYY